MNSNQVADIKKWLGSGCLNVFGLPFSGKDTQSKRLAKLFNAFLIGGGDIIRNSNREDLKKAIADGHLAPTDDYLAMVTPFLTKKAFKNKPLILNSLGRWNGEQETIMKAARESGHPIKAVIFLNITEKEVVKRWKTAQKIKDRGEREDDTREALDIRLKEFRNKTQPVIDYYRNKGLLIDVNGTGTYDEVTQEILSKLAKKMPLCNK